MKVQPANADNFSENLDKDIQAILLYGPDAGLISQRLDKITKALIDDMNDPFRVIELKFKDIKESPAILNDEIYAMSLTGGNRLIKIRDFVATIPKEISQILSAPFKETTVVLTAGELPPASSLRKLFEKENRLAAIACYKDDAQSTFRVIENMLRKNHFLFDNDAIRLLAEKFSGDRMVIISEVEKLITYMGDNKNITTEDVVNCISDSAEMSLDELCTAVASRNSKKIELYLNKAFSEGVAPVTIIRAMSRYFARLQQAKHNIQIEGMNEQQALSSLSPPIFFKQAPTFKQHLRSWSLPQISKVSGGLIELEIACKTTGNPAEILCARFLTILPVAMKG